MTKTREGRDISHTNYKELSKLDPNDNSTAIDDASDDEATAHAQCGLGGFRCRCLQVLAHPNAFVTLAGFLFLGVYGTTGVYLAAVISTIEKRFQLKSSESGLLMSMNDIAGLCGVLFITHFGGKFHRPRVVGISGLVVALGSFVCALPQFIFDNPSLDEFFVSSPNQSQSTAGISVYEELLCNTEGNVAMCTAEEIEASGSQFGKAWPVILGQLLGGLGTTAMIPLSVTYVDDAVEKTLLPMYLALMWLPMTIASLVGFSLSGYCLSIFTDFYKTDTADLGVTPHDPQWQGAWWLGFVFYGFYLCLASLPFFFFPRVMDKPKSYCCCTGMPDCCKGLLARGQVGQDAGDTTMAGIISNQKFSGKPIVVIKEFLSSIWRILTNLIFMSSMAGFCLWILSIGGFSVFTAKYIQYQFGADPSTAGLLLGFTAMPGSLIGILLGGIVTSRLAGNQRSYAVLSLVIHSLCVLVYVIDMFMGCPNTQIAGLTTEYEVRDPINVTNSLDMYAPCNMGCICERGVYSPVCGEDNVTYVTACFAGCNKLTRDGLNQTIYQNCSCIQHSENTNSDESTSGFAMPGACASECGFLIPFAIMVGVSSATSSLSYSPAFMMKFRSVLDKDRNLALGLSSFLGKTLGFIPAPVIFGAIIETQCSYWQESCQETGECLLYDRPGLRFAFLGLTVGFRLLSVLCFVGSAYFVFEQNKDELTPEKPKDIKTTENDREVHNGDDKKIYTHLVSKETEV